MNVTANAGYSRRIAILPLVVTVAVHLVVVLVWFSTRHRSIEKDAPERFSLLIQLPLFKPREAMPAPRVPPQPRPTPAPAAPAAPTAPAPQIESAPSAAPQPILEAAPSAPYTPEAEEMLGKAKQQAGVIDRELRGGKSGVPREANTPWARFRRNLAAAHIDRSHTMVTDSYTGPDGVTIYRVRQGDKIYCRSSGSVLPEMPGRTDGAKLAGAGRFDTLGRASSAGTVDCPSGERDWVAH
ncbi:hypothetical protein [Massilia horti]|uniref:hypothetical protein n=1 Tax=Massilia horti TaxID=2562153 RepID=UPI00227719A3|nr:hypothetical protein [Massilia horti]